ncbi:MAG: hypothetical protein ABIK31_01680 [candidate division WOR-3 bacterium]
MKETSLGFLVKKDFRILLVAIVLAIISIMLLNVYVRSKEKKEEVISVLITNREIPIGTVIDNNMIGEMQIPKSVFSDNMARPADKDLIIGRTSNIIVPRGVPILFNYLSAASSGALSPKLNPETHERLLQISIKGPVEHLRPGVDRIDIYGTFQDKGVTKLLFQNITVVDRVGTGLLLKLFPDEVIALQHLSQLCDLNFVIRNPKDQEYTDIKKEMTINEIFQTTENLMRTRKEIEARVRIIR